MTHAWFEFVPLPLFVAAMLLVVFGSIEFGFRLASHFKKRREPGATEAPISSVIGGSLGLLGFLLAFTFGLASSRFDARRQLLLDEVNAIGTCHLRADFIPDAERDSVRQRLGEYVHLRAELVQRPDTLPQVLVRADILQHELWEIAVRVVKREGSSETTALFVDSLNTVIDFQTKRVAVSQYHIPGVVWLSLVVISVLSMAGVGYQFGNAGRRDLTITLLLALSFAIVIGLIADLDRNSEGALQVNQQPILELDRQLNAAVQAQDSEGGG